MELSSKLSLEAILDSENIVPLLDDDDSKKIGLHVAETFEMDRLSRAGWEERMEKASKIALQVAESKTFPWPGASNVKFPLITIAALQYHSRAYPALIDTPDLVHCLPVGPDPTGQRAEQARRIGEHMSWQLTEEDEDWEEESDRLLFVQALMGCAFKKVRFDADLRHGLSELVLPQDLVLSYFTKSIDRSPRATHILSWTGNYLHEQMARDLIVETPLDPPKVIPLPFGRLGDLRDRSQGLTMTMEDPDQPFIILEQHNWLDLDGDGYKEPYVSYVRHDTRELLRVVPRFLPSGVETLRSRIARITPERFFVKYPFIPSPDGGFYDLGFGHLLGPLNESIDTSINQLFDAGTMHNAGGGFLGRGARIKGGSVSIRPNEWVRVDATGDDLRKSIVELPLREPSAVLFNLLTLLIDYGQRVAGAPDVVQGQNPGQNTPAETSRTMLEQGIKIFSGIYKRTYRASRKELRLRYRLNEIYLEKTQEFISPKSGLPMKILAEDYKLPASAIRPAADPNYMSDAQRMNQAMAVMQAAHASPGYDLREVNLMFLRAWKVPGTDLILPDPKGPRAVPPRIDPKVQVEQIRAQLEQARMQQELKLEVVSLIEEHELNQAKIHELEAKAIQALAEAQGVKTGHAIAALEAAIGAAKAAQDGRLKAIEMLQNLMKESENGDKDRMGGMAGGLSNSGLLSSPGGKAANPPGGMGLGPVH